MKLIVNSQANGWSQVDYKITTFFSQSVGAEPAYTKFRYRKNLAYCLVLWLILAVVQHKVVTQIKQKKEKKLKKETESETVTVG